MEEIDELTLLSDSNSGVVECACGPISVMGENAETRRIGDGVADTGTEVFVQAEIAVV